ncbi:MAG: hypothetical protein IIY82_07380, partial [Firmicutes bacterium]|nr:hypothetical protein [Bacillota bacterium]
MDLMKWILPLLILVPFLSGLILLIRPVENTHRRNTLVMTVCSLVSAGVLALLLSRVLASGGGGVSGVADISFLQILGADFSITLRVDGMSA